MMQRFEQIAEWIAQKYVLTIMEPYLLGVELSIQHGKRHQSVFLSELIDEDQYKVLRVSTVVANIEQVTNLQQALAFNWQSRAGFLAISHMDDKYYLNLCENRPYDGLTMLELERTILRIGGLGDQMEYQWHTGDEF
jgi:hypothetical protein